MLFPVFPRPAQLPAHMRMVQWFDARENDAATSRGVSLSDAHKHCGESPHRPRSLFTRTIVT